MGSSPRLLDACDLDATLSGAMSAASSAVSNDYFIFDAEPLLPEAGALAGGAGLLFDSWACHQPLLPEQWALSARPSPALQAPVPESTRFVLADFWSYCDSRWGGL